MKCLLAFLLFLIISAITAVDADAERLFQYPAEVLKVDHNKLYLWVDAPLLVNSDFSLEVKTKRKETFELPIKGVLDKVIITDTLPQRLADGIKKSENFEISVYLESELVSDSLVIALPYSLRSLWLDTIWVKSSTLPLDYKFRYYDDIQEVEIAAALGRIDVLIMPEPELLGEPKFADCPYELEWYLICDKVDDNLLATALTYCFKGEFTAENQPIPSIIIDDEHIAEIYPRNFEYSRELFGQAKSRIRRLNCSLESYAMYPNLTDSFNEQLSSCGDRKFAFTENNSAFTTLTFVAIDSNLAPETQRMLFIRDRILPIHRQFPLWENSGLDSCVMRKQDSLSACSDLLSRALAESGRVIPLGRTGLAIRKFDHVRFLNDQSGTAKLSQFYTVKE